MNPSLKQQLQDWKRKHQESTPKIKKPKVKNTHSQKPQKPKSENLSESDKVSQ